MSLGVNTLASIFERKRNGLNAIRLALAIGVIVWHSFPLTGRNMEWEPARELLGHVWVDGFFAISGFLIVGSWLSDPRPVRFLKARALRIFPAFYACLIMTALVLAPLAILMSGSVHPLWSGDSVSYVLKNSLLWTFQRDISDATSGNPFPGAINGSIWTLSWEFFCYLGVLALGVSKLLRLRLTLPLCFVASWAVLFACTIGIFETNFIEHASRFGLAFTAGALVYMFRFRLPVSKMLVGTAGGAVIASAFLPEYILAGAPFLAYFLIAGGGLIKNDRLTIRNDFSYGTYIYAFPVQQLLALSVFASAPVAVFGLLSVALTLPLAALSWFLIEKPAQRLKQPSGVRSHAGAVPSSALGGKH